MVFKVFPNPEHFDPQRFLTKDGQLGKVDEFIPFGVGKRCVCILLLLLVDANEMNPFFNIETLQIVTLPQ
jgi:hypothetical protein